MVKYILLMYAEVGAWPPQEHELAIKESIQLCRELEDQGHFVAAAPLQPSDTAKCVRVRQGTTQVSDGPFAETKEQLGGFFLIDVDHLDQAISIAARVPGTRRGTAEIRPLRT